LDGNGECRQSLTDGVIFLPWTTLAYLIVFPGGVVRWDWAVLGLGLLIDLVARLGTGVSRSHHQTLNRGKEQKRLAVPSEIGYNWGDQASGPWFLRFMGAPGNIQTPSVWTPAEERYR
jgi:hypothetical protein